MGLSNYPPGVTGMEPEIAGYPERTVFKDCQNDNVSIFLIDKDDVESLRLMAFGIVPINVIKMQHIYGAIEGPIDVDVCPFEGDIDVQYADMMEYWACPVCGMEHEDDVYAEEEER